MRVVINAVAVHRGGGLTVVRGLMDGLRQSAPAIDVHAIISDDYASEALKQACGEACVHQVLPKAGAARRLLWQNTRMGDWAKRLAPDVMISVNHYAYRVRCPQVVYHLNLLRFLKREGARYPFAGMADRLRDSLARKALLSASANVFESDYLRSIAQESISGEVRNSKVVYIGLPDKLIKEASTAAASGGDSSRLVAITSPAAHKDNATLVRALSELIRVEPSRNWRLDVAGGARPDVWRAEQELAKKLGVASRITWHGFCDAETLTKLLGGALCLVSASRVESFAMVALEAMARGCPPIVCDCAAMPESVGEAGIVVPPGSPYAMSEAVRRLASDPTLRRRYSESGRGRAVRSLWSDAGRQFAEILQEVTPRTCRERMPQKHASAA